MDNFWKQLFSKLYDPGSSLQNRFSLGDRKQTSSAVPDDALSPLRLLEDLDENVKVFRLLFSAHKNHDFITRNFNLTFTDGSIATGYLLFLKGVSDQAKIENLVLKPLIQSRIDPCSPLFETVLSTVLLAPLYSECNDIDGVKRAITMGKVAILLPMEGRAILIDSGLKVGRNVENAQNERTIFGPHEGFTESLEINSALIRNYIRSEHLVAEYIMHQNLNQTSTGVFYLENLTNSKLVEEVKRRIQSIKIDFLLPTGVLQQLLEDEPKSLIPTLSVTERPDRAAGMLLDGHVIVMAERSPFALICPTTLWTLIGTSDDVFLRTHYSNFIRLIRLLAIFFALLTPGIYIALTNYQPEMIPTDLMLHIAGSRETLPFPSFLEVLIMEISFELIREAGIRIPVVIGSTIGIVGALILGQAAVQANIISPLLVITVSITGLGSFAIPNQDLSFAVRIGRFIFFILGSTLGFFGISYGMVFLLAYLASHQSFGVPFMAPMYPRMKANFDFIFRGFLWKQSHYGQHTRPKLQERSPQKVTNWLRSRYTREEP
ncbi:spore germination protein [Paenibacillus xanthanilyticus]|uniref:Spore germination protein n=1 Tax=Paenibacillus xanthanilyticus TaxID=1783531 RepID=A0ABV8K7R1_9BACL